ncbi:MAG: DUF3558 family protein [Gordonia sp.]|nr:DUF3558 family protein [Gordonia sp. (in: high G+C Gram-positive bacteria)]
MCMPSGCSVDGSPTATVDSRVGVPGSSIRQTDARGVALPFVTPFPDRWSTNNDGTTYEPCTALTDAELGDAGLDPATAMDVAVANHQTARGCIWYFHGGPDAGLLSHATGNRPTFEQDMKDRGWYEVSYDISIKGRLVLVDSRDTTDCMATVKSGKSPVIVGTSKLFKPIGREAVCQRAIDFMKRVIDRMPPPES